MPYCTLDDVVALLPEGFKVDDSTTKPTSAQVTTWILRAGAQVDVAIVGGGGAAPAAGDLALDMAVLVSREVAYQCWSTRTRTFQPTNSSNTSSAKTDYQRWHEEFLERLAKLNPDATAASSSVSDAGLVWAFTQDADETDPSDSKNPSFTKDYVP